MQHIVAYAINFLNILKIYIIINYYKKNDFDS